MRHIKQENLHLQHKRILLTSGTDNIHEIQFFSGSFEQLKKEYSINEFVFKEHPLNSHYIGTEDERDWLCKIDGDYLSFFKY